VATKTHPIGTKLQFDLDGIGSYTDIADVRSVTPPSMTTGVSEVTHLLSPNNTREYVPGLIEGGEASFTIYMTKTQVPTIVSLFRVVCFWRILFPLIDAETVNSKWDFKGFITDAGTDEMTIEGEDAVTMPIKIKVTEKPTFTAGS
jgi:hypothetical protein